MSDITLVIISPLRGLLTQNDNIILTAKFVEGMRLYHKLWEGPVLHICEPAAKLSDNLDNIEIPMKMSAFDTICAPLSDELLISVLPKHSVVVTSVGEQFNSISKVCRSIGVPCIYIAEYSLRTRLQIVDEYQKNPLRRVWQKTRQIRQEIAQRRALAKANGVQCNGLPTYRAYQNITPDSHLFFDSRTDLASLATYSQISNKYRGLNHGEKFHLAFSGRLTLMKGADDLLKVARHLRDSFGDWFKMSIFGDGDLARAMESEVARLGLGALVKMHGNVDFSTELLPAMSESIHLFVCCHRQGDPSCTYLETMSCGVPIIGYANESWEQLSAHSRTGWVTKIGNPEIMAAKIYEITRDHSLVEKQASKSLDFSKEHTFDQTFARRVRHFRRVSGAA